MNTALSPYYRGAHCNLFMALQQQPELIGATIHYLDSGMDSGSIISTVRPEVCLNDNFELLDAKAFIAGINEMVRVVAVMSKHKVDSVKQWCEGQLFLKRTGYVYSPYLRLLANKTLVNGCVEDYLNNKAERDEQIRLVDLTQNIQ